MAAHIAQIFLIETILALLIRNRQKTVKYTDFISREVHFRRLAPKFIFHIAEIEPVVHTNIKDQQYGCYFLCPKTRTRVRVAVSRLLKRASNLLKH